MKGLNGFVFEYRESENPWEDERVVESLQKINIFKMNIENKNQACYCIDTQMNSNICTASIVTNSFTSDPDNRGEESKMKNTTDNTCLIKEVDCIYWYIYINSVLSYA